MFFVVYIILCFVVGTIGSSRKIGFGGAFLWSLFLSPLIGFILAVISERNADIAHHKKLERLAELQVRISSGTMTEADKAALVKEDPLDKYKKAVHEPTVTDKSIAWIIVVIMLSIGVYTCSAQSSYMNFKIENRDAVWQKVYEIEMDSASLANTIVNRLKSSGYIEQVEEVDGRIVFNLKDFIVDYKKFGGSLMTTAFIFSNGQWQAKGEASVKNGKFRMTLIDIRNNTDLTTAGVGLNGTSYSSWSELCLTKNRNKFKDGWKGEIGMLDRAFYDYFDFKKAQVSKSDW